MLKYNIIFLLLVGVGLSPLYCRIQENEFFAPCTAATSGLLYQPQMIGEGDCGAIVGNIKYTDSSIHINAMFQWQ
jgi:hypothetical protein